MENAYGHMCVQCIALVQYCERYIFDGECILPYVCNSFSCILLIAIIVRIFQKNAFYACNVESQDLISCDKIVKDVRSCLFAST